jgi:hypothetical protein
VLNLFDTAGSVARRTKKAQPRAKGATKAVKGDAKKAANQMRGGAERAGSP